MYITPGRFQDMATGVDLGDLDDANFAMVCERASAYVDTYCNVPLLPQKYDFRGGTMTGEQHQWRLPDLTMTVEQGARRVYPFSTPIRSIDKFVVKFTNTYQVEIASSNLYVNKAAGWAEVVSIAAIVTGIYPVGINFGLYTPVAEIDYTYGYEFTADDELLQQTDGETWRAANQFWLADPAPVITINGVIDTDGTVDRTEGTVAFPIGSVTADDVVRATYHYPLPPAIRDATAMIAADMLGEREMHQRGMGHLGSLRVEEIEMRREMFGRGAAAVATQALPPPIQMLLDPYEFKSVR